MLKYAKLINEETKQCEVGLGNNTNFYETLGFKKLDVEQAYNGLWYLNGYCPIKPEPTLEEVLIQKEQEYNMPRVIREGILGNPTMYSEFNVNRAKELEAIAEKIRQLKAGN